MRLFYSGADIPSPVIYMQCNGLPTFRRLCLSKAPIGIGTASVRCERCERSKQMKTKTNLNAGVSLNYGSVVWVYTPQKP
jgi:hypothetical protein